jgi:hypothetical protein
MAARKTILERFKNMIWIDTKTECWIWIGSRLRGYGLFTVSKNGKRKTLRAHRLSWMLYHRKRVPDGLEIDHLCNRKSCCNPEHLEATTHGKNIRRAALRGVWSGTRNSQAKLSEFDALFIRKLFDRKRFAAKRLAELCDVSVRTIYNVLSGTTYTA